MGDITVGPLQLKRILMQAMLNRRPVLIAGAPGCGKSDIVNQAREELGQDMITSHPVISDPTHASGFPWPDPETKTADFLPFGALAKVLSATEPTVWFLDDFGQATPAVQASYMQPLLTRMAGNKRIPDCVTMILATNKAGQRSGVASILEPVKGRVACIVELAPTLNDWLIWACSHDIRQEVIAYHQFKHGASLNVFKPTADMTNSPTSRTWSHVSEMLNWDLKREDMLPVITGAVGAGEAPEFVGFMRVYDDLPKMDHILRYPDSTSLPTEISAQHAVVASLAKEVAEHRESFSPCMAYMKRFRMSFTTLFVVTAIRLESTLQETEEFIDFASSEAGEALF